MRDPRNVLHYPGFGLFTLAFFVYLSLPIAVVVAFSFNANRLVSVWTGFSLWWYGHALDNENLLTAVRTSLTVATISAVLATMVALVLAQRDQIRPATADLKKDATHDPENPPAGRNCCHRPDAARPICVTATDCHCAQANTAALRRAGILYGADVGPGSDVVIGADGLASGELREFAAMDSVGCLAVSGGRESLGLSGQEPAGVNHATRAQDIATFRDALQPCAELGITSVCNMDGYLYQARLLGQMADKGQIDPDISLPMTQVPGMTDDRRHTLYDQAMAPPLGKLRFGAVKIFMESVFDTWTAFRTDGYLDRPGCRGTPLFTPDEFRRSVI